MQTPTIIMPANQIYVKSCAIEILVDVVTYTFSSGESTTSSPPATPVYPRSTSVTNGISILSVMFCAEYTN